MSRRPQQPGSSRGSSSSSSTSRSSTNTTPSPWQTTSLAWLQPEVVGSTVALSSLEMASRSYCCRGRGSEEESLLREKVLANLANLANLAHSFTCSSPSPPHALPFSFVGVDSRHGRRIGSLLLLSIVGWCGLFKIPNSVFRFTGFSLSSCRARARSSVLKRPSHVERRERPHQSEHPRHCLPSSQQIQYTCIL